MVGVDVISFRMALFTGHSFIFGGVDTWYLNRFMLQ